MTTFYDQMIHVEPSGRVIEPYFGQDWLGRQVEFTLLGQKVVGKVIDAIDTICARKWIIAEFRDGTKQIKVGGPYQAFHRLD